MSDLGDLLELIYSAGERWRTVRLTIRAWQHPGRTQRAIERLNEQGAGGMRQVMVYGHSGGPEPEEIEHIVRVWLDGDRAREEREFPALEREDTRATLSSAELPCERLTALARSLQPVY